MTRVYTLQAIGLKITGVYNYFIIEKILVYIGTNNYVLKMYNTCVYL